MNLQDALSSASEKELDLVLITDKGTLPVAKIIDYGKYKYEKKKKAQAAKKNQKIVETKEVRLTPRIGVHDLQVKIKDARRFIEKGDKVKVSLRYRRNELNDTEPGKEVMRKIIEELKDIAVVTKEPTQREIFLDMFLEPKK
jgi:translation initiation factor IF-3